MQQHTTASHLGDVKHAEHEHHWEVSWAPMAIAFGTMFLVPLSFALYFSYGSPFAAVVTAGIGAPLVLAGIGRWIHEGATQHSVITGVSPIGIGVFIIGEILIFLGLFAAYWTLRIGYQGDWPPPGTPHINLVLPLVMTAILVSSSVAYHFAEELLHRGEKDRFLLWIGIALALGLCFLGCTIYEYTHLVHEHFLPSTNAYSAAFFSLTGFHASHVFVGLGTFVGIIVGSLRGGVNGMFVTVAGIYWHFVDVVWFFVASQVYFW
jgi:cytochrome c oxidase subunit 3